MHKTLYPCIDQGPIAGVSNQTLREKRQRRKRVKRSLHRRRKRPGPAASRETVGHWEMNLVARPAHGSNAALPTLVERKKCGPQRFTAQAISFPLRSLRPGALRL